MVPHRFGRAARAMLWSGMLALAGCSGAPPVRTLSCADAPRVAVTRDEARGIASAEISVMTYNMQGLPWPAGKGRGAALKAMQAELGALHKRGEAPDIILFQEMFSGAAKQAVAGSGYGAIVSGPRRLDNPDGQPEPKLDGKAQPLKGEVGIRILGSGLAIASRFPIIADAREAYGQRACAGMDCFANKGILMARVAIPNVPYPLDIFNSHMNARIISRVPEARNGEAHRRQVARAANFIAEKADEDYPIIFGGDFNMRDSLPRWAQFREFHPLNLVHDYCIGEPESCFVEAKWEGDPPWLMTHDLQFFADGRRMTVTPIKVESLFDGHDGGAKLSDHAGLKITYRIEWLVEGVAPELVKNICK